MGMYETNRIVRNSVDVLDYAPLFSTGKALIQIGQTTIYFVAQKIFSQKKPQDSEIFAKKHTFSLVREGQSLSRSFILLVPGFGNIFVMILDLIAAKKKKAFLENATDVESTDRKQATLALEEGVKWGSDVAALRLAEMSGDDEGGDRISWLRKAAEMGNIEAMNRLVIAHGVRSVGTEEEVDTWASIAAQAGHPASMTRLGLSLIHKDTLVEEYKGVWWLTKAATLRYIPAMKALGELHTKGDCQAAKDLWVGTELLRVSGAQFPLQEVILRDVVAKLQADLDRFKNPNIFAWKEWAQGKKELFWILRAERLLHNILQKDLEQEEKGVKAEISLGCVYERGQRVVSDTVAAATWYKRALTSGDDRAALALVKMHDRGDASISLQERESLLFRAASYTRDAYAQYLLARLFFEKSERAPSTIELSQQAHFWKTQAVTHADSVMATAAIGTSLAGLASQAFSGQIDAMFSLGQKYENGDGIGKNLVLAELWYERAVYSGVGSAVEMQRAVGSRQAMVRLAFLRETNLFERDRLLVEAANCGEATSFYTIIRLALEGKDFRNILSLTHSLNRMREAAERGNEEAVGLLSELYISTIASWWPEDLGEDLLHRSIACVVTGKDPENAQKILLIAKNLKNYFSTLIQEKTKETLGDLGEEESSADSAHWKGLAIATARAIQPKFV